VLGGGGRDEGGELEAEPLHVQPPVLLHVLPLHPAPAAAALPPALHLSGLVRHGGRSGFRRRVRAVEAGWWCPAHLSRGGRRVQCTAAGIEDG
jgi:hypothetical protein